jgi:transposase
MADDIPRRRALEQQGLVNPTPDAVSDERFEKNGFFDPADLVQVRYEMLRSVRVGERSATAAAAAFGVSRATYYQVRTSYDRDGIVGLIPQKRGPRGPHKLTAEVLDFVDAEVEKHAGLSFTELAMRVTELFAITVHPKSIERALAQRRKKKPDQHG